MQRKQEYQRFKPYGITVKPQFMLHLTDNDYKRIVNEAISEAQDSCGSVRTEVEIAKDNDALVLVEVSFDYEREFRDAGLGYIAVRTDIYNFSGDVTGAYDGWGDPDECDFSADGLERAYKDAVRSLNRA